MNTAICTGFDYEIPFETTMAMIREAGFRVVALGARPEHSGYATAAGRATIRRLTTGMAIDSVHAPFPEGDRLFSLDESERRESVHRCEIAVEAAAELACPIVVIHLIQPYDIPHGKERDRMIDQGRRSVAALAACCETRGVKLALENGQRADYDEVVAAFLTEFDVPHVGFCYDSGHEHVQGACFRLLERFGDRLLTFHLHDNNGSDIHLLPYEGTIPWDRFGPTLRGFSYRGNLLLEADIRHSQFQNPAEFLAQAKARAEALLAGDRRDA
jgi:L-ribulose-5-phosphate 3-epimerase